MAVTVDILEEACANDAGTGDAPFRGEPAGTPRAVPDEGALAGFKRVYVVHLASTAADPLRPCRRGSGADELLALEVLDARRPLGADGRVNPLFSSLLRPLRRRTWATAMRSHGISPGLVAGAPSCGDRALSGRLQALLDAADVLVLAHAGPDLGLLAEHVRLRPGLAVVDLGRDLAACPLERRDAMAGWTCLDLLDAGPGAGLLARMREEDSLLAGEDVAGGRPAAVDMDLLPGDGPYDGPREAFLLACDFYALLAHGALHLREAGGAGPQPGESLSAAESGEEAGTADETMDAPVPAGLQERNPCAVPGAAAVDGDAPAMPIGAEAAGTDGAASGMSAGQGADAAGPDGARAVDSGGAEVARSDSPAGHDPGQGESAQPVGDGDRASAAGGAKGPTEAAEPLAEVVPEADAVTLWFALARALPGCRPGIEDLEDGVGIWLAVAPAPAGAGEDAGGAGGGREGLQVFFGLHDGRAGSANFGSGPWCRAFVPAGCPFDAGLDRLLAAVAQLADTTPDLRMGLARALVRAAGLVAAGNASLSG